MLRKAGDALRHLVEHRDHANERVGQQNVVGVEKEDVWRAGGGKPGIPCGADAFIVLPEHTQAAVCKGMQDFGCTVGRAVVDDDELCSRLCAATLFSVS